MTVVAADYEVNGTTPPEPVPPPPACRPQPTAITVTARRVVQTAPYCSAEVVVSVTVNPDPHFSAGENSDRLWGLVLAKVEEYSHEFADSVDDEPDHH